jgi:hypothetical protein
MSMRSMSTDYTLAYGTHATALEGRCAMEWVSYLAGEPHSDQPVCVSPVVRAFCIALNDGLEDVPRQRLRLYLSRTIGTAGDGLDEPRGWLAMDWLVRTYAPAWLGCASLDDAAQDLRALEPVLGSSELRAALGALADARRQARAVARHASAGPLHVGGLVARRRARETAWATAAAAAWSAARIGIGDINGDRARAAAKAAAGDAAITIERDRLQSTHKRLRGSAFDLLDRMLPTIDLDPAALIHRAPPARSRRIPGTSRSERSLHRAPALAGARAERP